jgi:hypothetical protein
MMSHTDHWPHPFSPWILRGKTAALRPVVVGLLLVPCLLWAAKRMLRVMDAATLELAVRPDIGHAVIGGVNVALLGIVLVMVLCGAYCVAGWAVGGLVHGALAWWAARPKSWKGWALDLLALSSAWGVLFYGLHSAVLIHYIPVNIEAYLVWFGLPGLVYAWAAALRQGNVI